MSKHEKLIKRLLSIPKDFTWEELCKVLAFYGYKELTGGKTGGSRRRFVDGDNHMLRLHKPHPGSILKEYSLRDAIEHLKASGHIKDE
ncbi:type II toxin-antitoxin system HicA family toxin [Mucilaginibacter psychrotolerans]|uniref:Type II toxin-antitoxin system HicA family toxin n=1 Tax=Mucilaginibacter psychrotolerans TaxID=1524096 RepID=A0A4Y8SJN7_9SPHI|nr:type II toxin-antitoxin system HicA family toxin [Mucilaginibacter psychrotolerans]TFF38881.1 type II toxin-antitoxin system HicA family toxin [Mucilaginibacter psychrotolerans]